MKKFKKGKKDLIISLEQEWEGDKEREKVREEGLAPCTGRGWPADEWCRFVKDLMISARDKVSIGVYQSFDALVGVRNWGAGMKENCIKVYVVLAFHLRILMK